MKKLRKVYEIAYSFMRKIRYDHVSSFAGHAALFILMSLFPMVMFALSMLEYLPLDSGEFSAYVLTAMQGGFTPFFRQIIQEAYAESTTVMLKSVTMIAMLFCASRGVYAVIIGMNAVYGIRETRNIVFIYLLSIVYVIAIFAMLGLTLGFIVLGNRLFRGLLHFVPWLGMFHDYFKYGKYLCMLVVLVVFLTLLYMTVPNRKSRLRYEFPGALFSTAVWLAFSGAFAFYIDHFSNYSVTYGSLATIVIFILWLYGTMNIVFIGGEINVVLRIFMEYGYNYRRAYEFFKDEYEGDLLKGNVLEHFQMLKKR